MYQANIYLAPRMEVQITMETALFELRVEENIYTKQRTDLNSGRLQIMEPKSKYEMEETSSSLQIN